MRRLAYTVHVPVWDINSDGVKYLVRTDVFTRGSELPEWAVPLVGDHVFEAGEAPSRKPEPEPSNPSKPAKPQPARAPRKRAARTQK